MSIIKNPWQFKPSIFLLLLLMLMVFSISLLYGSRTAGAAQQGTVVTLKLIDQAYVGEAIRVKLIANNAQNLAGFQSTIRYNNDLSMAGVIIDKGLSSNGRGIMPLELVRRDGTVVVGAATCPVSDCNASPSASIPRQPHGVDGNIELATLELTATEPGLYELVIENVQLVDPQGNQLGATTVNVTLGITTR